MHLGRVRPPPNRPGTGSGGWQRGSLTPQTTASQQSTTGLTLTTGGIERRPLHASEVADCEEHRGSAPSQAVRAVRESDRPNARGRRGTTPPASVVPPSFFRFRGFEGHPRAGDGWCREAISGARRSLGRAPAANNYIGSPAAPAKAPDRRPERTRRTEFGV
jgi:hypothetical protein